MSGDTAIEAASAQGHGTQRECAPARIALLPRPAKEKKQEACENAAHSYQEQRNSYIQARRSADAADAQVLYAYEQARVAAIGSGLGLLTMLAAIGAAIYAGIAAHHTKRAADTSRKALIVENRPWVQFTAHQQQPAKFARSGDGIIINAEMIGLQFQNTGNSPAVIQKLHSEFVFTKALSEPPAFDGQKAKHSRLVLAPGFNFPVEVNMPEGINTRLVRGEDLWVYCYVEYVDSNGLGQYTTEITLKSTNLGVHQLGDGRAGALFDTFLEGPQNTMT